MTTAQKISRLAALRDAVGIGLWRLVGRLGIVRHSEVRAMLSDPVSLRIHVLRYGPKGYDLFLVSDILDDIETSARQICCTEKVHRNYMGQVAGTLVTDSGARSTAADLLHRLAQSGRFRIVAECGRMVVGYWPENDPASPNVPDEPRLRPKKD